MNVAFGHTNMDLDCLGSLILIKRLFPDYQLVRSRLIHPVARNVYNMYQDFFDFLNPKDMEKERIDRVIIVDTCRAERVKEYFAHIKNSEPEILIFDHHSGTSCDIYGARLESVPLGSNTSFLGKMAIDRGLTLQSEEATVALTGLYADTGRLTYENVRKEDYEVAAYLLECGASLRLVRSFLETIIEDDQIVALNQLIHVMEVRDIQGHRILLSYLELESQVSGLAAVVEKVMEIENPDACFSVFSIRKQGTVLVIARSRKQSIDLHELLEAYGGGGHQLAASATVKHADPEQFYEEFCGYLEASLSPATRARDIMTREFHTLGENSSLLEASLFLEEMDITGVPVLNDSGELSGFLSLRDIMKGRRAGSMKAPVKAYMTRTVVSVPPDTTIRELERIFYKHHIGHLPVVEEHKLLGILTRWDYLQYQKRR